MNKLLTALCAMLFCVCTASAQRTITGNVIDRETNEAVMQATVSLLKQDSTFVKGVISDTKGHFSLSVPTNGQYLLKITSVAYKTLVKPITVSGTHNLGTIQLAPDAVMLKEAVVNGMAAKVVVKEDTFVYNAAAYHTPEGSVVEELIKRLPGAQIDDDGKITMNGKEVKKILVDGKEFMTGDTETALKNLPTSIIEKVRAFDQKSDLARVTGIDDGEEETVLDFGIKRGMNKGLMSNSDLSIGKHDRYAERTMLAYMKDNIRVMGFGSANNVGDRGFPGGGGGFRMGGSNGLAASKMLGANINYQLPDKLKIDASLRWNHNDNDTWSKKSSENFVSTANSFSNSLSQSYQRRERWNAQMRLEWTPDSMTNIMFRPTLSISKTDKTTVSRNASYNADPYQYVTDPLDEEAIKQLDEAGAMVNSKSSRSLSYTESNAVTGMLQFNRKLNTRGRNFTLRVNARYSDGDSRSASLQDVTLYQILDHLGNDSTYATNRYNVTPTKNYSYTLKGTYTEPIARALFLQMSYSYAHSFSKSDRATYDFSTMSFAGFDPEYRQWGFLPSPLDPYLDSDLSRYSEYTTDTHEAALQLRKVGKKWNYTAGIMIQPQRSHYVQDYQGVSVDTVRTTLNFSPTLDLRYKISKVSQLRATYRATTTQPSITDLLDITDDSDPLNISKGNPGLKPAFTHNFRFFYNGYAESHMQSWMTNLNFSLTQNSISSCVTYNEETGGKITRPENINGNWNINGEVMYNTSIDSAGVWNINTSTSLNYQNHVSYLYQSKVTEKNTTRTMTVSERLAMSYRNSWLEVEPNGQLAYTHTRNLLQPQSNLDTWNFNYGMNITVTAPWGTGFATDAHMNSRRGYNDSSLNTNEFVWNAQISQSFLKGNALTLSLQFYDILKNQSTLSRA
ncbi:MAG: outer membrane beta-barrel protein, partial [Prevotella sp.]